MTPPCLFFDGAMLGHLCSLVEEDDLFVSAVVSIKRQMISLRRSNRPVRSGTDKEPSCELTLGTLSPPPCQLHQATRLRSHPSHFASTALSTPHCLSRAKCEGVPLSPLNLAVSCKGNNHPTASSYALNLVGKDNPPPSVIYIVHQQAAGLRPIEQMLLFLRKSGETLAKKADVTRYSGKT
jgi:hypothetical protein